MGLPRCSGYLAGLASSIPSSTKHRRASAAGPRRSGRLRTLRIRTRPCNGSAILLPTRTSSLDFSDPPAVDSSVAFLDDRLGERSASNQPDAMKIAVDPHVFLSFASSAKAWLAGPRRSEQAQTTPSPRISSAREADIAHQPADKILVKPDRNSQRRVEGIRATEERTLRAWLASTIGEVNSNPRAPGAGGRPAPPHRYASPARVAAPAPGNLGIGWPWRTASSAARQYCADGLSSGGGDRGHRGSRLVERLAIGMLRDARWRRAPLSQQQTHRRIREHRRKRPDARRAPLIGLRGKASGLRRPL